MALPDPQRSRAVLIGTSKYVDDKLTELSKVGRTVADLAAALTNPEYGVLPQDHCTVLLDEAKIPLIGSRLRAAARQAEDLLLVYYTGHGLVAGRRHDLYLGLPESEWAEPEFNSLEYDKIRGALLDSAAATKVIILDCCFSGRVVNDTMSDPSTEIIGQIGVTGTYVLASAHRDQVALILPGEEHTAFTGRLLQLLYAGVPGGPEFLTIDDLYRQLLLRLKAEGLPQPQSRGTDTADLLALARNRAFKSTPMASLRQRQIMTVGQGSDGKWIGIAKPLGLLIGASLNSDRVQAILLDPQAKSVIAQSKYTLSDVSPQSALRAVVRLARQLRDKAEGGLYIGGLGVAVGGLDSPITTIHSEENRWNIATLEADLNEAVRGSVFHAVMHVAVENDASALAMYEYMERADGQTIVVVLIRPMGEGISSGIVINGSTVRAQNVIDGEIGHLVINADGVSCRCGGRGCLETICSVSAIVRRINWATDTPIETLEEASASAERGDAAAIAAFEEAGEALGRALRVLRAFLDQPHLLIFGPSQLIRSDGVASANIFLNGIRHSGAHRGTHDISFKELGPFTLSRAATALAAGRWLLSP